MHGDYGTIYRVYPLSVHFLCCYQISNSVMNDDVYYNNIILCIIVIIINVLENQWISFVNDFVWTASHG